MGVLGIFACCSGPAADFSASVGPPSKARGSSLELGQADPLGRPRLTPFGADESRKELPVKHCVSSGLSSKPSCVSTCTLTVNSSSTTSTLQGKPSLKHLPQLALPEEEAEDSPSEGAAAYEKYYATPTPSHGGPQGSLPSRTIFDKAASTFFAHSPATSVSEATSYVKSPHGPQYHRPMSTQNTFGSLGQSPFPSYKKLALNKPLNSPGQSRALYKLEGQGGPSPCPSICESSNSRSLFRLQQQTFAKNADDFIELQQVDDEEGGGFPIAIEDEACEDDSLDTDNPNNPEFLLSMSTMKLRRLALSQSCLFMSKDWVLPGGTRRTGAALADFSIEKKLYKGYSASIYKVSGMLQITL